MDTPDIMYTIKTASEEQIRSHLLACKDAFIPPLDQTVDIDEYARKLHEKSVTFEAWSDNTLAGLIAAYYNDTEHRKGYITSVSVLGAASGRGIASTLVTMCIEYAKKHAFPEIGLEVNEQNHPAIRLYLKYGFIEQKRDNQSVFMAFHVPHQ